MPRGNSISTGTKCSTKCPHFDISVTSKSNPLENFMNSFKKCRISLILESLKPAARSTLSSKLNIKQTNVPCCFKCNTQEYPIFSCLNCDVYSCWTHLKSHLNDSHPLAMEICTGTVFCGLCNIFIWNATMDLYTKSPALMGSSSNSASNLTVSPSKRKKSGNVTTTSVNVNANANSNDAPRDENNLKKHCVSMRGMLNLGNTCFMASVLQVLLHTNRLRDFFMSSEHNSKNCNRRSTSSQTKSSSSAASNSNSNALVCMACELDDLFNTNYCGEVHPFAPTQFLYAMWRSSKNLSGYEQQDAHEFLISVLGQLHTDLDGSAFACKCPVHTSFTGVLQSDVTCLSCGTVNASFDPFMDISLDILTSSKNEMFILDPNTSTLNLHECFQMFTHAEKLGLNTYMCSNCNHTYQEATKQLSIRKSPEILTIHLKRFEHSLNTIKIDTFLQFPLEFSIFDYTTEGVHLRNEVMISNLDPDVIDPAYENKKYSKEMLYKLVATVNHTGVVDSGHYVSYVSSPDQSTWYKFDDAMVTKVSSSVVLNSNAYMLFYERIGECPGGNPDDPITLD